ncbi:MAG: hypothetical protein U0931_07735 [Vulcanimicrobiota bacterium]
MHQGPDRIEFSPLLGRPIRQGSFAELSVSDRERVLQALAQRDLERLNAYWGYLNFGQQLMLTMAYEWALRWIYEAGAEAAAAGHRVFLESVGQDETGRLVAELLSEPEELSMLADPGQSKLAAYLPDATPGLDAAHKGDWELAQSCFVRSFDRAKAWHDLLFRHSYAVMSALLADLGAVGTRAAMERVLKSASFYEMGWQQAATLEPEQLAVVLAEHLRLHFSGPDGGGVEIIEEPDRIRLVLAPCGSGGTLRRTVGHQPGFAKLEQASEVTWGRTGEVPLYCSHCALNEIESMRRFGHKKWSTEFDPDPDKSCGWTLWKKPGTLT